MSEVFKKLSKVNVDSHLSEQNGFSYLPWAIALKLAKENLDFVSWEPMVFEDGRLYSNTGIGVMAGAIVEVLYEGDRIIQKAILPVLDFQNNSMLDGPPMTVPISAKKTKNLLPIKSSDVNKTIMRAMVKALAYCGLGLHLYSKEDFIEEHTGPENHGQYTHIPQGQQQGQGQPVPQPQYNQHIPQPQYNQQPPPPPQGVAGTGVQGIPWNIQNQNQNQNQNHPNTTQAKVNSYLDSC